MTIKILCPTDGTDHSTRAVECAAEMAVKSGANLTLCTVNIAHGGGRGPLIHHWTDGQIAEILAAAEKVAKKKGAKDVHTTQVVSREAATGIVSYAETIGADHIVLGTGDKRGITRLVLGSVAADVAGRAHCTVTVAR